ncbi:MAG: hypothetical protein LC772_03820 [Chloroflexi bacterium]|nr:hypothetical protein [Chloroflexota bacterium]
MISRITIGAAAVLAALILPCRSASSDPAPTTNLYVSPAGSDGWSGLAIRPERSRRDGPLASLDGARNRIRALRAAGGQTGAIVVHIQPGTYTLSAPFTLSPQDSGSPGAPITYEGDATSRPVISGGRVVTGIRAAGGRWIAPLTGAENGTEYSALWVNGQRRTVARTPNAGYFKIVGLADTPPGTAPADDRRSFRFAPGDIARNQR